MSTETKIIKRSKLINRLVLERQTVEDLGRVEQVWIDPRSHKIIALTCKSGMIRGQKRIFTWENITQIGEDAILVNSSPLETSETPTKPEEAIHGIGHEVWSDGGNKVGSIVDYVFDLQTGFVNFYLYTSQGLKSVLEGVYILPVMTISSVGNKRVIVLEAALKNPEQYSEGLGQKMGQAAEFFQDDFEKTREHLEGLKRSAQKITKGKPEEMQEMKAEIISEETDTINSEPLILPPSSSETSTDQQDVQPSSSNDV